MKVMTIVGTRPEIIRLSRVIARLERSVEHVLVHTGQNYDFALNQVFFDDLRLASPDHYLKVDTSSLGRTLGDTLIKSEEVLRQERPDAVLVLGDTNSSIAAVMARRMNIPVYHMEAGNRCFDQNVPEEINRRLVDHVADFNLVYTEHARRNLLAEGLHPRRILLTGSPMCEVLGHFRADIEASAALEWLSLESGGYFLASAHREENVDAPARLRLLLACLTSVWEEWRLPVVVSTHPRTRKRLADLGGRLPEGLRFLEPFGFHDYNKLQLGAACVLSDSGTVAEESAILGFPAVTMRDSSERPEALDAGGILMTGLDPRDMVRNVAVAMSVLDGVRPERPPEYDVRNTSQRVVGFILSTAHRHHQWAGIRDVPHE
ncbi:MAG: non-hydrolyzing UDP-N-acetylglucosamine 2-epimerase [Myxococcaceae bacterium]